MDLTYENWANISNEALEKMVSSLLKKERTILVELLVHLNIVFHRKLYAMRGYSSLNDYLIARFGLSKHQAWARAAVARIVHDHPNLLSMLEKGETCLSRLAMIASRLTPANSAILYNAACCLSKRELEAFVPRVTNAGEILPGDDLVTLAIKCSKQCAELFDHAAALARNGQGGVLTQGDVLKIILEDYIEKRDPRRKAIRAEKRRKAQELSASKSLEKLEKNFDPRRAHQQSIDIYELKLQEEMNMAQPIVEENKQNDQNISDLAASKCASDEISEKAAEGRTEAPRKGKYERIPIPAAIRHRVMLRDGGRCAWISPEGQRCGSRRHLQIDHITMICRGGSNEIGNLRVLCKTHNELEMMKQLGQRRDLKIPVFPGNPRTGGEGPTLSTANKRGI